jgi:hypothetical protein
MKISDFKGLISEMPYLQQAFDIKKVNWKVKNQILIDNIFGNESVITINRYDLLNSSKNLEEFIIKTLMWGYPTKGRGNNINVILEDKNLRILKKVLNKYANKEISISELKYDINTLPGVGLSTFTKFTHFLNTTINGNRAVILDIQIIETINTGRYQEFASLCGKIHYNNAIDYYERYLEIIGQLSSSLNVTPDQVEIFLFTFGRVLSELKN